MLEVTEVMLLINPLVLELIPPPELLTSSTSSSKLTSARKVKDVWPYFRGWRKMVPVSIWSLVGFKAREVCLGMKPRASSERSVRGGGGRG